MSRCRECEFILLRVRVHIIEGAFYIMRIWVQITEVGVHIMSMRVHITKGVVLYYSECEFIPIRPA